MRSENFWNGYPEFSNRVIRYRKTNKWKFQRKRSFKKISFGSVIGYFRYPTLKTGISDRISEKNPFPEYFQVFEKWKFSIGIGPGIFWISNLKYPKTKKGDWISGKSDRVTEWIDQIGYLWTPYLIP